MSNEIIINYQEFMKELASELESLKRKKSFEGIEIMPDIIHKISEMQATKFIPRTATALRYESSALRDELNRFFNPYVEAFATPRELLLDIKKHSCNFFTMEKAYQLSHARGIWRSQIDEKVDIDKDIKNYFLGRIFTDYYEALPLILYPTLRYHWLLAGKEESKYPKTVFDQFKFLIKVLGSSAFGEVEIDADFRKLRNELSHSSVLFKENTIYVWEDDHEYKARSPLKVYPLMEVMMNLLVIYATEIDLRILRMAKPENNDLFPLWIQYFENYVHWFLKNFNSKKEK